MLCIVAIVEMYTTCPLHKKYHIPYLVAIINCIHGVSATASLQGLGNIALENTTNLTADAL